MDWKLFASTFSLVFLAEIGDKTQLAVLSMSGGTSSRWTVFFAASLALMATTAVAVVVGEMLGRVVPTLWLRRAAGLSFVALGILFLVSRGE